MNKFEYKTEQFTVTIGINEGYSHNNEQSVEEALKNFVELWRSVSLEVEKKSGIFVTVRVNTGKVVYQTEKGCPEGGEDVLILQGTRNPYHTADSEKWREAVLTIVEEVKAELKQTTVQLIFQPIDLVFMKS